MKPVKTNRPMSEYESALLSAVYALGETLIESNLINETALLTKLAVHRDRASESDRQNETAVLESLMKFWGEPPVYYTLGRSAPKPSN
jgi:hypothetical protein